jgi:aryl-alcohol dehydrogenase-like predicted oxidoreductase
VDRGAGTQVLGLALDLGINHFDLARSYGFGEAEGVVGEVIRGRRDRVVLASKFGIVPNWKAQLFKPAKSIVRALRKQRPSRPDTPEAAAAPATGSGLMERLLDRPDLTPEFMRKSLDTTLRELRTDYLDYYFVHDPQQRIERWEELLEEGRRLKEKGKIRAFGLTYTQDHRKLHTDYLEHFDVLQRNLPDTPAAYRRLAAGAPGGGIWFSPMQAPLPDTTPAERLGQVLGDFSRDVVLCSTFNVDHLRQNARIAEAAVKH